LYITSFFVKNQIKDFFQEQGIFHYEWKDKTLLNSEINQWKNWLRSNSQYNLPQIAWARLVTQKWKKKINQDSLVLNPSLNKVDSYEKNFLIITKNKIFVRLTHFSIQNITRISKRILYIIFFATNLFILQKFFLICLQA
ncbi:unnamed protein product, partial [Brassica oleracea var. botrytis]